jgi:acyl transferase domain-containing protein
LLAQEKIRPFDRRADGFTIGEGCGLFLLKRLEDAQRDSDHIYAVICGIEGSNDAHSLIAPYKQGQILAMERCLSACNIAPDTVQFIETHGTGTKIGDTVETDSIKEVYGKFSRSSPLILGSIKSMVGHTWSAAGAAGLLKTILAIHHKMIPPHCNMEEPNLSLDFDSIPAYVNMELKPWPQNGIQPRRAGVSAFGTGGLNYHLILEEYR